MSGATMTSLLIVHLFLLLFVSSPAKADEATTTQAEVGLKIWMIARAMTSITVGWAENATAGSGSLTTTQAPSVYHVEAVNLDTDVRLISPDMLANVTEYRLPNLAVDAAYEMCIHSTGSPQPACDVFHTIPIVRDDSIVALLIALAVIAAIVIIALICWRCAVRQAAAAGAEDGGGDETPEQDPDDKVGVNEKSPLLVPTSAGPEDQAGPPAATSDPAAPGAATAQPEPNNQDQPGSLYLFLAGHAYK